MKRLVLWSTYQISLKRPSNFKSTNSQSSSNLFKSLHSTHHKFKKIKLKIRNLKLKKKIDRYIPNSRSQTWHYTSRHRSNSILKNPLSENHSKQIRSHSSNTIPQNTARTTFKTKYINPKMPRIRAISVYILTRNEHKQIRQIKLEIFETSTIIPLRGWKITRRSR